MHRQAQILFFPLSLSRSLGAVALDSFSKHAGSFIAIALKSFHMIGWNGVPQKIQM